MPGPSEMPNFKSGEVLAATKLNQLAELVARKIMVGGGLASRKFGDQLMIDKVPRLRPHLPPLQQMVVKSDEGDYLICRNLNALGAIGGQDVYVLKPWGLRRSPFDGETLAERTPNTGY